MKKNIFVGVALATLLPGLSALAADMPVKAPPIVPVDPWNWTGFYIGGNVGYSWGRERTDLDGTLDTTVRTRVFRGFTTPTPTLLSDVTTDTIAAAIARSHAHLNGWLGGGQAGYNWQSGRFVFGIEGDIQATGEDGGVTVCLPPGCVTGAPFTTATYKLDWFGTLRGRVGLAQDRFLFYATGGLAVGEISLNDVTGFLGGPQVLLSTHSTRAGFAVGAGGEAFLTRNWTVKVEYLFIDLGTSNAAAGAAGTGTTTVITPNVPSQGFTTVTDTTGTLSAAIRSRFSDSIVRIGLNYRFP